MKMLSRLLALLLALALCLPALAETSPEDVLATVDGAALTRAVFDACLVQLQDEYAAYGYDVTDPTMDAVLRQLALQQAVEYKLLDVKQAELGLQLSDAELADAAQIGREDFALHIDLLVDEYGYYGLADVSTPESRNAVLLEVLAQQEAAGVTEAAYIAQAQTSAGYDKVYAWIVRDVTVTDEEVRAHYDQLVESDRVAYAGDVPAYEAMLENNYYALLYGMPEYYVDLYYIPEGYRVVTHILLQADDTALAHYTAVKASGTAEEIAAAEAAVLASVQPDVAEISARLAAGEAFSGLIPDYTIDADMMDADAIAEGFHMHAQSVGFIPAIHEAAFALANVGDVSAPVVTDAGVHILCYAADLPGGPVAYTSDVQALLHESLLIPRQSAVYQQTMDAWMAEADIVYSEEAQAILNNY